MAWEDHVACVIGDDCVGMSSGVVEKLRDLGHGVLGRVCLLCG